MSKSPLVLIPSALVLGCLGSVFCLRVQAQDVDDDLVRSRGADTPLEPGPRASSGDDAPPVTRSRTRRHRDSEAATTVVEPLPEPEPEPQRARARPAPVPVQPNSRDAAYRARRSADMKEGGAQPRVRHRADFDGPDWDTAAGARIEEDPSVLSGAFRFALELTLVGFQTTRFRIPGPLSVGVDASSLSYGVTDGAGIGALFGIGLTDNLVLDTRLVFSNASIGYGDAEDGDHLRFQILPGLEYALGDPSLAVRPFGSLSLGLVVGDPAAGPSGASELAFLIGGRLGVHLFPAPHVSIEPMLFVGYQVGTATSDSASAAGSSLVAGGGTSTRTNYNISGFVLLLSAGVSFWS